MPRPAPAAEIARLAAEMDRLASPAAPASPVPAAPRGYLGATRTATYGLLAALPLFVLYEVGVLLATGGTGAVRIGADVWLKNVLAALGLGGPILLAAAVAGVGAGVLWAERRRRPPLRAAWFGGIVAESLVYAVGLAFLVGGTVGALFGAHAWPGLALAQLAELPLGLQLALSIGAGLYEELVFRVLLVGGLAWALRRVLPGARRGWAYTMAAVVGAVVFSAVHHTGPFGDPWALDVFTFRFLFGLALNGVFLVRGFGVAAWTHALYDVLVVTRLLG